MTVKIEFPLEKCDQSSSNSSMDSYLRKFWDIETKDDHAY